MSTRVIAPLVSGRTTPSVGTIDEEIDEEWSDDVLGRLGRRWTRLDHIPFGSTVDIDHVLLSVGGAFAVATEFTVDEWARSCPALLHAVGEARWRARKIEFLLDRVGKPRVTPMLVVCGPGAPPIAGGYEMVDGVLVCRGADAAQWRAHLDELPPVLDAERIPEMVDLIVDHTNRTTSPTRVPARRR
jgi:hypothetical protein